jgi:hypothetical protein
MIVSVTASRHSTEASRRFDVDGSGQGGKCSEIEAADARPYAPMTSVAKKTDTGHCFRVFGNASFITGQIIDVNGGKTAS